MFSKSHLATVALALAHLPSAFALATFTPYADASCTEQVTITDNNGQTYTEVGTGSGLNSDSPAGWINQATYSANATSGKSGTDVWWSVDGLDIGCRAALLLGYSQGNYGSMGNNTVPGNVIVNAKSGCIYSNLPSKHNIGATFCCGSDDCAVLGLGDGSLITKRNEVTEDSKTRIAREKMAARNSVAARDSGDQWAGTCKAVNVDGPWPEAGPQTIVANTQTCSSNTDCTFAISAAVSTAQTLTSSTSQTITNGFGASVTVSQEWNELIADTSVDISASYEWSKAISEESGQSLTTTNTTTVTNTLPQEAGTSAIATFTGTYKCYSYSLDCGNGVSDPLNWCFPDYENNLLEGDYNVVYLG